MRSELEIFRKSHGLSQAELAERLGISKSTVSMVENGRRDLPRAAYNRLKVLRQENQPVMNNTGIAAGHSFRELKEEHMRESEEYLLSYKKDCETALNQYEKQVYAWTKRYQTAVSQLLMAETVMTSEAQKPAPDRYLLLKHANASVEARETLEAISRQKPEIVMIKIEGLKQQLRSLKIMLGKQKRYLGMKEQPLILPAQIQVIGNPGEETDSPTDG